MNVGFTVYAETTGEIIRWGSCSPNDVSLQAGEGEDIVGGEFPRDEFYVVDGAPASRPEIAVADATIPADGADHVILTDMPAGTEVYMDGASQGASTETSLSMAATEPGIVEVRLEPPFPARSATFKVQIDEIAEGA